MMIILTKLMTDSSRCSRILSSVLLTVLLASFPLQAMARQNVWSLPQPAETVKAGSLALGYIEARDTYLSASTYNGFGFGFENDSWTGYEPYRMLPFGRMHTDMYLSFMQNPVDGGGTLGFNGRDYAGYMWQAVKSSHCDLLVGPAAMLELGFYYNQQNSNNPVNVQGYLGGGICVDNTYRFNLLRQDLALLATLYAPLAGIGFAPDYDQPYYYMLKYGAGKTLHFVTPFNNIALTQQMAVVIPIKENRLKTGATFDFMRNRLGGHSRYTMNAMFTIGLAFRYQSKKWER